MLTFLLAVLALLLAPPPADGAARYLAPAGPPAAANDDDDEGGTFVCQGRMSASAKAYHRQQMLCIDPARLELIPGDLA